MYEGLGYASTWDFLRRDLGLLECATARRVKAARLIRRFPAAIDRLRDGRLSMTALSMVKDVINDANAERLFEKLEGKSRDQIKKLVAELAAEPTPEKTRNATIRKTPAPKPIVPTPDGTELRDLSATPATPCEPDGDVQPEPEAEWEPPRDVPPTPDAAPARTAQPEPTPSLFGSQEKRTELRPVSGDRYDVSMRVSGRFVQLLKEATEAESHAVPDGNPEEILIRALELLLERAGKKTGKVPVKARKSEHTQDPTSAYISAELRRQVFVRDQYRCVWPLANGGLCESTHCLEPDHILAHAKSGRTELSNLRLLCRAHNQQAARETFGEEHIENRIRESRARRPDG